MRPVGSLAACYVWLESRRRLLFFICAMLLICCALSLLRLRVRDDIGIMLPATEPVQRSLALMDLTPFSRAVFVELHGKNRNIRENDLLTAAQSLREALQGPRFTPLLPADESLPAPRDLVRLLPALANPQDLAMLQARLDPDAVQQRMAKNYSAVLSMHGVLAKSFIQTDPLGFLEVLQNKWKHLQLFGGAQLRDGFLLKPDGSALLFILQTNSPVTDVDQAETLLGEIAAAIGTLPPGIGATVLSGHRYAQANARTIKQDLGRVFLASALGLALIFSIFIRSRDVIWIALLPGAALLVAVAALIWFYGPVSGITLGFGAVLLGITVDFALHVWFALRGAETTPAAAVARVSCPVLYGAATSLAAFAALLASDIAGIRQLALFAMVGLGSGLAMALLVFPQLVRNGGGPVFLQRPAGVGRWNRPLAVISMVLLGLGLWFAADLDVDRQLGSVGVADEGIRQAEKQIRENWGGAKDSAVLFSVGDDLDEALAHNHELATYLAHGLPDHDVLSLAGIWPPSGIQAVNQRRWSEFVTQSGPSLLVEVDAAAADFGFTRQAFDPFRQFLQEEPVRLDAQFLRRAGMGALLNLLHVRHGGKHYVLTLVPDTPKVQELAVHGRLPKGTEIFSAQRLGRLLGGAISRDFMVFVAVACGSMLLLLLLLFRRLEFALLAMMPLFSGLVAVMLLLRCNGGVFNMFHVVALPLIIGLGADYGIFMVGQVRSGKDGHTTRAVLVSGLTTLAGFGALVLARHPALHTLGLTVLVGVGAAIPVAVLLVPALYRQTP